MTAEEECFFRLIIRRKRLDRSCFFFCYNYQDRDEQTRLEMKHRKEEDDLYRKFAHHREEEDRRIREEFRVRIFFILRKLYRIESLNIHIRRP